MQTIVLYLLKVVLISGILVSYYWMALRNNRFHYYNRFYLLFSILISVVLPLLQLNWFTWKGDKNKAFDLLYGTTTNNLENVIITSKSNGIDWETFAALAMIIISAFFITTCIIHILKIYRIKKIYPATKTGTFDFIQTDLKQAPFSFFKNLFWRNDIEVNSETGKQIFEHEYTHIKQKHSWDKLFMQLLVSFFWINPFFWLIRKELYLIHEFIADEKAVENKDASAFAAMLLQAQFGKNIYSPGQSFNYSPIKRRLLMLTNSHKPNYSYLRRLMVLPLLCCVTCLFAFQIQKNEAIELGVENEQNQSSLPDTLKPTVIVENVKLDKADKIHIIDVELSPTNSEAADTTKPQPLYIVNGKEAKKEVVDGIKATAIERINVLKGEAATKAYGAKGKNGVVEIITKKPIATKLTQPIIVKDTVTPESKLASGKEDYEEVFQTVQIQAKFPGGAEGWNKYLQKQLKSDIPAKKGAPPGSYTVVVSFVVDKEGNLSDIKAENDPGYGTGEEAVRVIQRGPKWIPAVQNGHNVAFRQKQSIAFVVTEK